MPQQPAPAEERRPPTPRWVKVFVVVALLLAALAVLKVTGVVGEGHGPGRHRGATTVP